MDAAAPDHTHDAPQLRTLLLTDLCDSTALVERLGDTAAAALFRDHDRLVLELQQRWRGRLIDRSDGLLLLFERPIDGLGFALDYRRGLEDLGKAHDAGQLRARAGLHVGEVLIWRNSDEAVDVGAKQVEVEGLAKPFAARLMQLAHPGQILLSAVAEPLVRRSVRELGERADTLKWRSYGRWRFKGVPTPFEIHEVGEAGLAPLRTPRSDAKAWRDVPLWRRPVALLTEVLLLVGVGAVLLLVTRPEPAIAFAERDWVVVGDLRNLTRDPRYDGAIEAALRTGLEQSQFVNVMSDARVQGVLGHMQKSGVTIDRTVGTEVAQRTGARMLLLPTVSEAGNSVRIDLEVVDPSNGATVLSLGVEGRGADSAIRSAGGISENLRIRLGETKNSISRSSMPLEQVTTTSLDALRAFTLGQRAYAIRDFDKADQHFRQALQLDPRFAMARIGLARVAYSRTDIAAALAEMNLALGDLSRLSERERLYADAQLSVMRWDKGYLSKWSALSDLYPDFDIAALNTALGMSVENRFKELHFFSARAVATQGVTLPVALRFRAMGSAGLGDLSAAAADCADEKAKGVRVPIECHLFEFATGSVEQALAGLAAVPKEPAFLATERATAELNVLAAAGRWQEAEMRARALLAANQEPTLPFDWFALTSALSALSRHGSDTEVRKLVVDLLDTVEARLPDALGRTQDAAASAALHAAYVAADRGYVELAERGQRLAQRRVEDSPNPLLANAAALVTARLQTASGNPAAALETLSGHERPDSLALTWIERIRALDALGHDAGSLRQKVGSAEGRARIYAEWCPEKPPPLSVIAP